jgi:hypothetical protein
VDCSFAKDFAGPVATVVAAATAVFVTWRLGSGQTKIAQQQAETARQQAKTAKNQLRLNLFEKRYAVYKDIERGLEVLLTPPDEPEAELKMVQLFMGLNDAAFFFSPATCEWLKTVREDSQAFLDAAAAPRGERGDSRQRLDRENKLDRHLRAMAERFHDDLSLSQLTSD